MRQIAFVLLILALGQWNVEAQIIYGLVFTNGQTYFYKFNLATCEFCAVNPPLGFGGGADLVILPNGEVLRMGISAIQKMEAPPSNTVLWESVPGYYSGQLDLSGLVYLSDNNGLSSYDPATNNIAFIGQWPSTFGDVIDIFFINGVLHGNMNINGQSFLVEINTNDPSQSIILGSLPVIWGGEGGVWNGNEGLFYTEGANDIYFYNPVNESSILVCDIPNDIGIYGLSFPPPGVPEYDCLIACTTDAGTLTQAGPYNTCTNATLNFPAAIQTDLDNNDLLQYILFSNPADTAGSIVAVSNTPNFTFAPPMQPGVTYYVAAMAGNDVNGNVDLDDPCLDFSNVLQVTWRPLPAVTFSLAGSTDVCAGECRTITATFTGTAPFTLTYVTPAGTFTQAFAGSTGTFQVCVPPGAPPGALSVQATALTDAWCTCQ